VALRAIFLFGQLETDASLQACAYFGRIVALPRVKRVFLFGQLETDASLQACAYFGQVVALPRVKRVFSSVTTLSDRLGVRAPKAIRAKAVTYRAEGHFGD
jgi:hypothetical protein